MSEPMSEHDTILGAADLLALEQVGDSQFRCNRNLHNLTGSIFGGQLLGQAVHACRLTVEEWPIHSCAGFFLSQTYVDAPLDFAVEPTRTGRRFASRRVLASQKGRPVFDMICSFHDPEEGLFHQREQMDLLPQPEELISAREFVSAHCDRFHEPMRTIHTMPFPIELRPLDAEAIFFGGAGKGERNFWFRVPTADAISDPRDHQSLLAFMSDYWLAGAAGAPHRTPGEMKGKFGIASLNHSMWFHAPVRTDEWLYYTTSSPWAGTGRGLTMGYIYDRAGTLVASVNQEVSMRFG